MNSSYVETGTIIALLAVILVYLSHWPSSLLTTCGICLCWALVAAACGGVKLYKARAASVMAWVACAAQCGSRPQMLSVSRRSWRREMAHYAQQCRRRDVRRRNAPVVSVGGNLAAV
jgi:hypothetical protein